MRTRDGQLLKISLNKKRKQIFNITFCPRDFSESSLRRILSKLDEQAEIGNLNEIHINNDHLLFDYISIEDFKLYGNEMLNQLKIIITTPVVKIDNDEERLAILQKYHDNLIEGGHCGQRRLYAKIRSRYYWKNLSKDIKNYVRKCHQCQINKSYIKTKEDLQLTSTPKQQLDVVTIDTIGQSFYI